MRLGCCLNMLGNDADPIGAAFIPELKKNGYDYAELPLAQVMELSEPAFAGLLTRLADSEIGCECMNNFFPPSIRLTGEEADHKKAEAYMKKAFARAVALGARVIVFGSSGAKNVPEGFPRDKAFEQIADTLLMAQRFAEESDILIAIEPLNRQESNIIQNLEEGYRLMNARTYRNVKLLVDYYHFSKENENLDKLAAMCKSIAHVHFASPRGRVFPSGQNPDYDRFFQVLREGGYSGRVSVEAYSQDPLQDLEKGRFLKMM